MKITIALVCAIASIVFALLFASWLNSRKGTGRDNARLYAIVRGRISNFRSFQLIPVIVFAVIVSAAAGIGIGWKYAGACMAGALTVMIPLMAGSLSFPAGVTAAYNEAAGGDLRQSVRSGYRTGAVLGLWISGIALGAFSVLFLVFKTAVVIKYCAFFALGAAVTAMIIHTAGEVYTSAYSLAVPSGDFTDRSGSFTGSGADLAGSFVTAGASAILLADVAVATSGVTSTFTAGDAARFPILVLAAGIVGSVIGVFIQRAGIGNDFSRGAGAGCIAAGIVTAAASVYLSMNMMQSRVYAYSVIVGIAAALILSAINRIYSSDSRLLINSYRTEKSLGRHTAVVFNFGTGMISTAIYTALVLAATAVSFMFASYYGVALCAAGMISVLGSMAAVTGMVSVDGTVSDYMSSKSVSEDDPYRSAANLLDNVFSKNLVSAKSYSDIAGIMAAMSAFCALYYVSEIDNIDLMSLRVFIGIIIGVSSAFLLAGLIIGSVRITGLVALRDIGRNEDDTGATSALRGAVIPSIAAIALPTLVGLFGGVKALAGFNIAAIVTGYMLIASANNAGMHYESSGLQSLSSVLKMMAVFSVAFLPVFMKVGGFLFQ